MSIASRLLKIARPGGPYVAVGAVVCYMAAFAVAAVAKPMAGTSVSGQIRDPLESSSTLQLVQVTDEPRRRARTARPESKPETDPSNDPKKATAAGPPAKDDEQQAKSSVPSTDATNAWTIAQIDEAKNACLRGLAPIQVTIEPQPPLKSGSCGAPAPVLLKSVGGTDPVSFSPPVPLTCQMVVALHDWIETVVQPLSKGMLGGPVAKLQGISSYQCRPRVGDNSRELSEHAFANAIDISVFVATSGARISVLRGWGLTPRDAKVGTKAAEVPAEQDPPRKRIRSRSSSRAVAPEIEPATQRAFLMAVHRGACKSFSTVLGPDANEAHRDHLHLDYAERRNGNSLCE